MQSEISPGTVLQNRYRIIRLLGQGGFGRTYLAENQRRFNELCALKEFIPPQGDDFLLQKAHELFLREAATLYQIEHPQIPKFRETFEENDRLFLVQDYVAGQTYAKLLEARVKEQKTFSEAEVFQLIDSLLPVLDYLHQKGIIHRDISPENIICRERDRLPVLIDFGVVKALVTQMELNVGQRLREHPYFPSTTVGKIGYAPSEQIQSGRSYPSSDLYSLAVTAIVLLSGREPQELFDGVTLTWQWEKFVQPPVSSDFAHILHRMLSYRPGQRYQSVSEVAYAFDQLKRYNLSPQITPPVYPTSSNPNSQPRSRELNSEMPTVAMVPPHDQDYSNDSYHSQEHTSGSTEDQGKRSDTMIYPDIYPDNDEPNPLLESPIAIGILLIVVSLFTGITAWVIVMAFNKPPTPVTPEATPIFANPEVPGTNMPPSTSPTEQGTENQPSATNNQLPTPTTVPTQPTTTDTTDTTDNREPAIFPSSPAPTPKPTPAPEPTPQVYHQPIEITLGVPQILQGQLKAKETINYKFQGEAGEELLTFVSGQGVLMNLIGPNGEMMENVSMWEGSLPATGEYTIALKPLPDLPGSNYELQIELKPRRATAPPKVTSPAEPVAGARSDSPTPTSTPGNRPTPSSVPVEPAPKPQPTQTETENLPPWEVSNMISFPGGTGRQQINGKTTPDQVKSYFVNVEAGKTMKAEIFLGAVSLNIRDPNGNLLPNAEGVVSWAGQATMTGVYQIDVVAPEALSFSMEIQVRD